MVCVHVHVCVCVCRVGQAVGEQRLPVPEMRSAQHCYKFPALTSPRPSQHIMQVSMPLALHKLSKTSITDYGVQIKHLPVINYLPGHRTTDPVKACLDFRRKLHHCSDTFYAVHLFICSQLKHLHF